MNKNYVLFPENIPKPEEADKYAVITVRFPKDIGEDEYMGISIEFDSPSGKEFSDKALIGSILLMAYCDIVATVSPFRKAGIGAGYILEAHGVADDKIMELAQKIIYNKNKGESDND